MQLVTAFHLPSMEGFQRMEVEVGQIHTAGDYEGEHQEGRYTTRNPMNMAGVIDRAK